MEIMDIRDQKLIGKTGVYAIIIDGVIRYIGSSGSSLESRKSNHLSNLRYNKHKNKRLQELFNLHGEDKFEFYCLDYCDIDSLYELEKLYIKIHEDTVVNEEKIIKLNKHIRSEEESRAFREKMSLIMSGEGNPNCCKLSEKSVREIIKLKEEGINHKEIADKFNISESYVYQIGTTRWLSIV